MQIVGGRQRGCAASIPAGSWSGSAAGTRPTVPAACSAGSALRRFDEGGQLAERIYPPVGQLEHFRVFSPQEPQGTSAKIRGAQARRLRRLQVVVPVITYIDDLVRLTGRNLDDPLG